MHFGKTFKPGYNEKIQAVGDKNPKKAGSQSVKHSN